jgi:hypothetical protein
MPDTEELLLEILFQLNIAGSSSREMIILPCTYKVGQIIRDGQQETANTE